MLALANCKTMSQDQILTQPVVDPEIGNDVSHCEHKSAVLHPDRRQSEASREEAGIA